MELRDQDGTVLILVSRNGLRSEPIRGSEDHMDVVRMAQQAGFPVNQNPSGRYDIAGQSVARFARFAALARADEKSTCIEDCNAEARDDGTAQRIIERIRARSQE